MGENGEKGGALFECFGKGKEKFYATRAWFKGYAPFGRLPIANCSIDLPIANRPLPIVQTTHSGDTLVIIVLDI